MSGPSSPIDDGTPMNVNPHSPRCAQLHQPQQQQQPDVINGQPPAQNRSRHIISSVNDDSNPDNNDNDQPQSSPPSRPIHAHSLPSDSPPSPMQQDSAPAAASAPNEGAAAADANVGAAAAADANVGGAAAAANATPQVKRLRTGSLRYNANGCNFISMKNNVFVHRWLVIYHSIMLLVQACITCLFTHHWRVKFLIGK